MKSYISIVIPFHTVTSLLYRSIDSVKDQEYKDWECILVGDNISNDQIEKVLSYINLDVRFKLIEGSGGANSCRNTGIENSDSKYLIFLDADDLLMPNCLKDRITFFEQHEDNDFIISQTATFKNNPSQITGYFRCQSKESATLLIKFLSHNIQWNTTAPTWKRTFLAKIGNWNIDYPRLQDVELNIGLANKIGSAS